MAPITGVPTIVDVSKARQDQTWEGRYVYPPNVKIEWPQKTSKIPCPLCAYRFLRRPTVRPRGRVIYVCEPPNPQQRQRAIVDPTPKRHAVLGCRRCGITFTMTYPRLKAMEHEFTTAHVSALRNRA